MPAGCLRAFAIALLAALPCRAGDGADFFEKKVRPVFVEHCYACHAGTKTKGGLRLDTPEGIRQGGDSGPAVKAKDNASLLLQCVTHAADAPAMPPKGKLPDAAIADLKAWVALGAPLPAGGASKATSIDEARKFWAFQPVAEKPAPPVSNPAWPVTKADAFILKKLDDEKLPPSPPADKRTLVRRAYFDLTGLPPTYEQVEAFVADAKPDAYARLVDHLLASPRFGEKWGRHWLDVARYAEDNSTGESTCKPPRFPWRYRDWVIVAFNADVPFDRFVRLQLAADLVPGTAPADLPALGFLGLSPVLHKEPKLSKDVVFAIVADEWDERVDAVTRGFLGVTVACARCHDHKFDPFSTADYHALAGVMANTRLVERPLTPGVDPDALQAVRADLLDATLRLSYAKEMRGTALKERRDAGPFEAQARELEAQVAALKVREKALDTGPIANVVRDAGTWVNGTDPAWTTLDYRPREFRDLPVFVRGNTARPGEIVSRRFPVALSPAAPKPFAAGSGRRELADAIVTDAAGLTARVFVNRVWGWVYGRHLVGTPSNFGALGERPTHPELLDDLAARFVANKWSMKWLVRELVISAAYQQDSRSRNADCGVRIENPGSSEAVAGGSSSNPKSEILNPQSNDVENKLYGRGPRKRLELEAWRDAMLQASGQLDLAGGGPSDNLDGFRAVRRTVFGKVSRERPADVHRLFDLPDPRMHGEKREATTTPVQQLYFLNSPFVRQAASTLAKAAAGKSEKDGVTALFRKTYLRDPSAEERETATKLVKPAKAGGAPAWESLSQALLASNEFLFLD